MNDRPARISLIAALSRNRVIGRQGSLPWHLPDDLAFFKKTTSDKAVIMGRKTWESIGCRPLPKRRNIIISRNTEYIAEGAEVAAGLSEALAMSRDNGEVMICGGQGIYEAALPLADRMYLTHVQVDIDDGDAFFPKVDPADWQITDEHPYAQSAQNPHSYTIRQYDRR